MKVKVKSKNGLLPGEIIEERQGKLKVKFSQYPDGSGREKSNWFENKELVRVW
jgi:hypothetical protein